MSDQKISLQDYYNAVASPGYKKQLSTFEEVVKENGWTPDLLKCDGGDIKGQYREKDKTLIYAECVKCGKFIADVTLSIGSAALDIPDEMIDSDTPVRWIAGVSPRGIDGEGEGYIV